MAVTFAQKLAQMPGYQAGVPKGKAPEAISGEDIVQLASNESPRPPHPDVQEAIRRAAASMNRYPDPQATLLRRRLADRYEVEPGLVAVGNGSCEILLAAAAALCETGDEIVYGWPAFSMYPYLPALTGAREVRVPLGAGEVHDLEAMLQRGHGGDPDADRLQPQQPDRDPHRRRPHRRVLRRGPRPRHGDRRRGLHRVPGERRPRCDRRPAPALSQPGPPADLQQVLRPRRPAGRLRAGLRQVPRRGRRRPPALQRQRARPGRGRGGGAPRRRRARPGRGERSSSGSTSRAHSRSAAWRRRTRRPTSPGSASATPTRPRWSGRWPSAASSSARARRWAGPATSASPTAPASRTKDFSRARAA